MGPGEPGANPMEQAARLRGQVENIRMTSEAEGARPSAEDKPKECVNARRLRRLQRAGGEKRRGVTIERCQFVGPSIFVQPREHEAGGELAADLRVE